jgi:hypothetical protein
VNDFVEECRREWRRLRVPGHIADEMAAELAADLEEAAPQEVLGSDALDARAFAARWAAERGVARPRSRARKLLVLAAILVLVAVAGVGGALAITARDHPSNVVPLPSTFSSDGGSVWVASPTVRVVLPRMQADDSGTQRTIGSALLIAGLAGIALLALVREVPDTLKASGTS